jgi:hypothetical protein
VTPVAEEGVRYHSPLHRRLASAEDVFDSLALIAEIGLALAGLVVFATAALAGVPLVWAIVGLAVLVLGVLGVLVFAESRSWLTVSPEGVVVRNGFRTRLLAWTDISRFEAGDGEAEAILRDGRHVPIRGLRDRTGFEHFWLIQELNGRLASRERATNSGFWGGPTT